MLITFTLGTLVVFAVLGDLFYALFNAEAF